MYLVEGPFSHQGIPGDLLPDFRPVARVPDPFGDRRSRGRRNRFGPVRRNSVQEVEIELHLGETIQVGDNFYTVIDIDGGEVNIRVDSFEEFTELPAVMPPAK